jgi:hypothetical protein
MKCISRLKNLNTLQETRHGTLALEKYCRQTRPHSFGTLMKRIAPGLYVNEQIKIAGRSTIKKPNGTQLGKPNDYWNDSDDSISACTCRCHSNMGIQ